MIIGVWWWKELLLTSGEMRKENIVHLGIKYIRMGGGGHVNPDKLEHDWVIYNTYGKLFNKYDEYIGLADDGNVVKHNISKDWWVEGISIIKYN